MSVTKPAIREALAQPRALPLGHATTRARTANFRAWLLTALLLCLPVVAYWPATFHEFGLRDDYSNLREAREEPGTVVKFCASHARPIYGWLLQATYAQSNSVQNLQWMRLASSVLLGAIALVMFRGLRFLGWTFNSSLCFALLLTLVPSAQVIAGWAIGWPYAAAALLAIAAFFTVEGALAVDLGTGSARAAGQWLTALLIMVIAALIYQPSALFYVVPLAGALIAERRRSPARSLRWVGVHLGLVVASLGVAYITISLLYDAGVFVKSGRIAFEHHWGEKLAWFLSETLPNGLSLFVLNDDNQRGHGWYLALAGLVGLLLIGGIIVEWRRHGRARGMMWTAGVVGLPVFAAGISLVASERYATYRTIFAMTGVLLVFLVASVRALTDHWSPAGRRALGMLTLVVAFFTAQHHVYALIAVPQGNEWRLILAGAKHVHIDGPARPTVFAIASAPTDISTRSIYHDEFGSLSSNSEWVPKEMFKQAMHDLHPEVPHLESRYEFTEGYSLNGYHLPPGVHYDVVIDMHKLRGFHTDN